MAVCHSPWSQTIFAPVVREVELPLVFWLHNEPAGKHWLEKWAGRIPPDSVICCSEFVAGFLSNLYPGVTKNVIYYPVRPFERTPEEEGYSIRRELKTKLDDVVIIQISRMERWKGQSLHLQALSKLASFPNWVCWMVGGNQRPKEEAYFAELKAAAAASGIADRVRFLGQRSDIEALLSAANVFCQPNSGPEPFGIVFVEALWAGLPVVTAATGGGLEIVDSTCGTLVRQGDLEALVAALGALITDEGMRKRMSVAGPGRAAELCLPEKQMRRLAEVLESVARRSRQPNRGALSFWVES